MPAPVLALVGCGAIADFFHLPALTRRADLLPSLILVDRDLARAQALQKQLGAAAAVADYREVASKIQGAIVATPHHLHHPITLDLVSRGIHVLCEKPLASTAAEVDELVAAAAAHKVQIAVNHTRRLFSSNQEIRRLATSGELGEVREIHYELGEPFQWPAATATYFGVKAGGKGVLFDTGAHIIDLVCWWMGGQPEIVRYADDSYGGTEAMAELTLQRGTTTAQVRLSWLSKLRNTWRVVGSRATVEGGVYEWSSYQRRNGRGGSTKVRTDGARDFGYFADMLLTNFTDVIAGRAAPITSAADARPSIAVIEQCYAQRSRLPEPWHDACQRLANG